MGVGARSRFSPDMPAPPRPQLAVPPGRRRLPRTHDSVGRCRSPSAALGEPCLQRWPRGGPKRFICCGSWRWRPSTDGRCENMAGADGGAVIAPSRRTEEMPPWPRGPAGRRAGGTAAEKECGCIVGFRSTVIGATSGCIAGCARKECNLHAMRRVVTAITARPAWAVEMPLRGRVEDGTPTRRVAIASSRYGAGGAACAGR